MRLYNAANERPSGGSFTRADEEDCYAGSAHRRGIWLTSEPLPGPVRTVEVPEELVAEFEVSEAGDTHRTFVVPIAVLADVPCELQVDVGAD